MSKAQRRIVIAFWIEMYHNFPKFSDRQVWANRADPDQTAPKGAVWSGSTLFAIPPASFRRITLRKCHLVQLLGWLQQILWVSEYLGNLRYMRVKICFSGIACCHNFVMRKKNRLYKGLGEAFSRRLQLFDCSYLWMVLCIIFSTYWTCRGESRASTSTAVPCDSWARAWGWD